MRWALSELVLVTPPISWSMSLSAFFDASTLATDTSASGRICESMTPCENAVEVATCRVGAVGHVCSPVVESVVHSTTALQVLLAASGVAHTCGPLGFAMIRFQHWFSALRKRAIVCVSEVEMPFIEAR